MERSGSKKHREVIEYIHDLYIKKNNDYGNSFSDLYKKFGIVSPVIKLWDKMSRIDSLIKNEQMVKGESIRDSLIDLANYAIMTVMELDGSIDCTEDYDNVVANLSFDSLPFTIAVDFDETICFGGFPDVNDFNSVNDDLISELIKFRKEREDSRLILWTTRTGRYLNDAVEFCNARGLYFDYVNKNIKEITDLGLDPRKIYADVYIDDRSCDNLKSISESPEFLDFLNVSQIGDVK